MFLRFMTCYLDAGNIDPGATSGPALYNSVSNGANPAHVRNESDGGSPLSRRAAIPLGGFRQGTTVTDAVREVPLSVAVRVTVFCELPAHARTSKKTVVLPGGTVTAETGTRFGLLLFRLTTVPLDAAGLLIVIVTPTVLPPLTTLGMIEKPARIGAFTVRTVEAVTP